MKKEIPYIHYIRVIACVMVVALHTLPPISVFGVLQREDTIYSNLIVVLTKPCVPLFFMITGALLLPFDDCQSWKDYYKKRISRILYPLLVWGVVYSIVPFLLGKEDLTQMTIEMIESPLQPPAMVGGILWYLFILIGIYLVIPFINPKIYSDNRVLSLYMVLWMLSSLALLLQQFMPNLLGINPYEHNFNLLIYFSGYLGYLLLGFYSTRFMGECQNHRMFMRIFGQSGGGARLSCFQFSFF